MKIQVPHNILNAVMVCTAPQDVRTYVHGFHIELVPGDSSKANLIASDGYRMIVARADVINATDPPDPKAAFRPQGKLGVGDMVLDTTALTVANSKNSRWTGLDLVDAPATIPWERVMPADNRDGEPTNRLGLNAMLVAEVQKALGAAGTTLDMDGKDSTVRVTFSDFPDVKFAVMPMRL